jgi:hypothetical protein
MFAWLKRRHLNLQKRMIFQNNAASEALEQFYATHRNPTEALAMKRLGEINRLVAAEFDGKTSLPNKHLRTLLAVNKELHRHDLHLFKNSMHFDEAYRPAPGWEDFYNAFPER